MGKTQLHAAGWTDDRVAALKKSWAAGHSANEIARALGGGVTRLGVIGKVHRLGLPSRDAAAPPTTYNPATRKPNAPEVRSDKYAGNGFNARGGKPAPFKTSDNGRVYAQHPAVSLNVKVEPANDDAVRFLERRKGQCAWPVGEDADRLCCGHRTYDALPYCLTHARRAYARDITQPAPKNDLVRQLRRWAS